MYICQLVFLARSYGAPLLLSHSASCSCRPFVHASPAPYPAPSSSPLPPLSSLPRAEGHLSFWIISSIHSSPHPLSSIPLRLHPAAFCGSMLLTLDLPQLLHVLSRGFASWVDSPSPWLTLPPSISSPALLALLAGASAPP